jgi:hypothetical protein
MYALNRPTAIEHKIVSRIAKAIDPLPNDTIDDPLVRMWINRELTSFHYLIIHYTHEERFRTSIITLKSCFMRIMYKVIPCETYHIYIDHLRIG